MTYSQGQSHTHKMHTKMHRKANVMADKCTGRQMHWKTNAMVGRKMHGRRADAWQAGRCMAGRKMHDRQEDALAGRKMHGRQMH